jgi:hypothetical protein
VFPTLTVEEPGIGLICLTEERRPLAERGVRTVPEAGRAPSSAGWNPERGRSKMLGLARTLLGRPRLLLLDEPTEGVWHGVVEEILAALRSFTSNGAVLLVEQHLKLALDLHSRCHGGASAPRPNRSDDALVCLCLTLGRVPNEPQLTWKVRRSAGVSWRVTCCLARARSAAGFSQSVQASQMRMVPA